MTWIPIEDFEVEEDFDQPDGSQSIQFENTPLDVLYFHPRSGEEVWVSGYVLFNPAFQLGSRKGFTQIKVKGLPEARLRGRVPVHAPERGLVKPMFVPGNYVRPHVEGTPLFEEAFGKVNGATVIQARIDSEKEDLRLGQEAFQEEVQEVEA